MNISVIGLGYVGTVTAALLANEGHDIIGVDVNDTKVGLVNSGKSHESCPVVLFGLLMGES